MASPFAERPIATIVSSHGAVLSLMATMLFHACKISSLVTPCLKACTSICTSSINSSNFVQRYSSKLYLRKLSLCSVVSRILQKRKGHPGDGCRPRHSRRPNTRRESICTGSCDARILARAQMFVQVENRTYFRYYGHQQNARRPCAFSRHSPKAEAREHATAKRPPFSHICKRPHRLRNGDAALVVVGPTSPSNGFAGPAGRQAREFRTARITSIRPRSHRRAWEPRRPGRWATCNKRWPRNSPGCRGARARARRAACRPRHARLAAA